MTHVMTQEQWALFAGRTPGWSLLRWLTNFKQQRSDAVAGMGGGTYYFRDETRGWYATLAKGKAADDEIMNWHGRKPELEARVWVPWTLVKEWSLSVCQEDYDEAEAMLAELAEINTERPPLYPSIGRAYAWDTKPRGSDKQCEIDRADLKAAQEAAAVKKAEITQRTDERSARAHVFCERFAPTALDDMILASRAA